MNKYNQILEMFNHTSMDVFKKPFILDGLAASCDSHVVCYCNAELTEGLENLDPTKYEVVKKYLDRPNNKNHPIHVNKIEGALSKAESIPETKLVGEDIKCEECNGTGEVEWTYSGKKEYHYDDFECPVCDGSGFSQQAKDVNTGNITYKSHEYGKIGNSFFSLKYIHKMLEIAKYLGHKEIILIHQTKPSEPSVFSIGEIGMLIMPMMGNGDEMFSL